MSDDAQGSPARLVEIARAGGGAVAVLHGRGAPFYAGLRRKAADSLLETSLTFLAQPAYEEIVVFSGIGDHLPPRDVGSIQVSLVAGGWYFRGQEEEDAHGGASRPMWWNDQRPGAGAGNGAPPGRSPPPARRAHGRQMPPPPPPPFQATALRER